LPKSRPGKNDDIDPKRARHRFELALRAPPVGTNQNQR
jgi:hypothetical protein